MRIKLAAAPISWGVCEVPGWGLQLPAGRVLREAARFCFSAIEAGPPGFLPADPGEAARLLHDAGLRLVGGLVTALLHDDERRAGALSGLDRQAKWLAAAGGEVLELAAAGGPPGYDAAVDLDERAWGALFASLAAAEMTVRRHGLMLAVHPHFGTAIERREHVERFLSGSDLGLCLDTGHLLLGADSVEVSRIAAGRVRHVHLKDAEPDIAARVRRRDIGYAEAVRRGLYRPLGEGGARIGEVLEGLRASGYAGWYVLEQDVALDGGTQDPAPWIEESARFARTHA